MQEAQAVRQELDEQVHSLTQQVFTCLFNYLNFWPASSSLNCERPHIVWPACTLLTFALWQLEADAASRGALDQQLQEAQQHIQRSVYLPCPAVDKLLYFN